MDAEAQAHYNEANTAAAEAEYDAYEADEQAAQALLYGQDFTQYGRIAVVKLPDAVPDEYFGHRWEVPLTCSLTGQLLTGFRGGDICIRRSDGRISVRSIPSVLEADAC
jgi:hypothetical protein